MKEKIRVLIADDSLFMRTYFRGLLVADPDIDVVGVATTGDEVVALALLLRPDVITMDYHMPIKNGIEAAAEIMKSAHPLPTIIMLSAFSGRDGGVARRKLEASGAHIIVKPSGEVSLDIEKISGEIVKKIKEVGYQELLLRRARMRAGGAQGVFTPMGFSSGTVAQKPRGVVVIGASTGGPPLVERLLTLLDPNSDFSVVIVQHMSKYFTELFAERLDRVTGFSVREARSIDVLEVGTALVVPGGHVLVPDVTHGGRNHVTTKKLSSESHEVMIDRTMETIASLCGNSVVGVLLSGMGTDGAKGLSAIRDNGGLSIAQDPATALVSSMPAHALRAGAEIHEISEIPERIKNFLSSVSA